MGECYAYLQKDEVEGRRRGEKLRSFEGNKFSFAYHFISFEYWPTRVSCVQMKAYE